MKDLFSVLAVATLISACSQPHVFEVDVGETQPQEARLVLYDTPTPMERTASGFIAERPNRADGAGYFVVSYAGGRTITCNVGYVTSGEDEPHRYVIRDGQCR